MDFNEDKPYKEEQNKSSQELWEMSFGIKYLRNLGFDVDNTAFKENSKYCRDALVLANGRREQANDKYPKKFFENLLLEGKNELEVKIT